jgi:hypothetical protein
VIFQQDTALNQLYLQAFQDLGRFDYDRTVVGVPVGAIPPFLTLIKNFVQRFAGERAAGRQIPDAKFRDKVISGQDIENVVKAAYVLVPEWEVGKATTAIAPMKTPVVNPLGAKFNTVEGTVAIPVKLRSQIFQVSDGSEYAHFDVASIATVRLTQHYREGDAGSLAAAVARLTAAMAILEAGGPARVLQSMPSDALAQALELQSPDRMAKRRQAHSSASDAATDPIAMLPGSVDPEIAKIEQKPLLTDADWGLLARHYQREDDKGASSFAAAVLGAFGGPTGVIPQTLKSARSLDAFRLAGPLESSKDDQWVFPMGNDQGVDLDTWFHATVMERDNAGKETPIDKGYMKIRSTSASDSTGQAIFVNKDVEEGDQLTEIPLVGTNLTFSPVVPMVIGNSVSQLAGAKDMVPTKVTGVGLNLHSAYDISPYLHRLSGRTFALPELYSVVDLTGYLPVTKVTSNGVQSPGFNVLGFGFGANAGLVKKFFWRNWATYVGIMGGTTGFTNDTYTDRTGKDRMRLYLGGSAMLGLNWQLSPTALLDLGVSAGMYWWTLSKADAGGDLATSLASGRTLITIQPRFGVAITF